MGNMLRELRQVGSILIESQKMIVLCNSLPVSCAHLKMIFDQSDTIRSFDYYANHLVNQVKMNALNKNNTVAIWW